MPARWLLLAAKRCSALHHGLLSNSRAQNPESQIFILDFARLSMVLGVCIGLLMLF
ncbi:hypothetical protein PSEUDO8BK_40744 [Pseudomonas sp. 8BK]|nr:hypothetical protein PSEUDO8BK_40744 [Pseudomonas sp. 8BK]